MMLMDLLIGLLLLIFVDGVVGVHRMKMEKGYNLQERPASENEGEPLEIRASINLRNILDVSEKEQLVSMETTLRLFWKDPRIKPSM